MHLLHFCHDECTDPGIQTPSVTEAKCVGYKHEQIFVNAAKSGIIRSGTIQWVSPDGNYELYP